MGAITQSERAEWAPEEWDSYLRGEYDSPCGPCMSTGKVIVADESQIFDPEEKAALKQWKREQAEMERELQLEERMRSLMGGEW